MKVVIHLDGRTVRGNERQVLLLSEGLLERGHSVVVACRRDGHVRRLMEGAGVPTGHARPRGDLDPFSLIGFALWLRRQRADALLLTSWKRYFSGGMAGRLAGVDCILVRVGGPHRIRGGISGWRQRTALTRWPHRLVANSTSVRDHLLAQLPGLEPERVRVVPNGVPVQGDQATRTTGGASRAELREQLGVPEDAVLLLAVGGLEALKGHDLLIDALARSDTAAHVAVAGSGEPGRVERLGRQAEQAGVGSRVHLLGHRDDVPRLLSAADALVHSSREDSMPNAVLEAMAAGVPVVATGVHGAQDLLEPREGRPRAGWVVPRDDPAALSNALRDLTASIRDGRPDPGRAGEEGRWRAAEWFGVGRMVDGYEAALRCGGGSNE